ncbi:hypothetical protein ACSQ67_013979 [Phaseolus vulgaris]
MCTQGGSAERTCESDTQRRVADACAALHRPMVSLVEAVEVELSGAGRLSPAMKSGFGKGPCGSLDVMALASGNGCKGWVLGDQYNLKQHRFLEVQRMQCKRRTLLIKGWEGVSFSSSRNMFSVGACANQSFWFGKPLKFMVYSAYQSKLALETPHYRTGHCSTLIKIGLCRFTTTPINHTVKQHRTRQQPMHPSAPHPTNSPVFRIPFDLS